MWKVIIVIGYCLILVICSLKLDAKYGDTLSPIIWFALFVVAILLGRISKGLDRYIVHSYLFFGIVLLLLLVICDTLYKLLSTISTWI